MKTIYIADDGKQFDNKYECEHYELELKKHGEKPTEPLKVVDIKYYKGGSKLVVLDKEEQFLSLEYMLNSEHCWLYTNSTSSIVNGLLRYFKKWELKEMAVIFWEDSNSDGCPIEYELAKDAIEDCKYEIKCETILMNKIIDAIKELGGEVNE